MAACPSGLHLYIGSYRDNDMRKIPQEASSHPTNSPTFMELEDTLPCTQYTATGPQLEKYVPQPDITFL
jgi:hypothetical protein